MVFQQKLLEKAFSHFQTVWSGNGPAGQFWQMESVQSVADRAITKCSTQDWHSPASRAFFCLLEGGGKRGGSARIASSLWVCRCPNSGLVIHVFSRRTSFFECEDPFINKSVVITEPALASARITSLQHAVHAQQSSYLTDVESFSSTLKPNKRKKASPGRMERALNG